MDIRRHLVRRVGPQVLASVVVLPALLGLLIHLAPRTQGEPYFVPDEQRTAQQVSREIGFDCDAWADEHPFDYPPGGSPSDPIAPISPPVAFGKPYCIEVGHCGLEWIVDFDASFWSVTSWDPSPHPERGANDDWLSRLVNGGYGSMRLVGVDEAEYLDWRFGRLRSSDVQYADNLGATFRLEGIEGPIVPFSCA